MAQYEEAGLRIGDALRRTRTRRGIDIAEVEAATKVRAKYLRALENEEWDVLPGSAYTKGFLRTYADYLGLQGQQFVDEYDSRFAPLEQPHAPAPAPIRRRRPLLLDPRLLVLPGALLLGLVAWQLSHDRGNERPRATPTIAHVKATTTVRVSHPPPVRKPATAKVVLLASRGACWLSVRVGSDAGRVLYEGTLAEGKRATFVGRRLWIRLGAPWNLEATLNGKALPLPGATASVTVTPSGLG
jgi:transcriptional regulator with XRE-family HTH domain